MNNIVDRIINYTLKESLFDYINAFILERRDSLILLKMIDIYEHSEAVKHMTQEECEKLSKLKSITSSRCDIEPASFSEIKDLINLDPELTDLEDLDDNPDT